MEDTGASGSAMQGSVEVLSHPLWYHLGQLSHAGLAHLLDRSERPDKGFLASRSDPLDIVEYGVDHPLPAELAVIHECEAMGLVTDPLEQVEGRLVPRDDDRVHLAGNVHLLHALRQPCHGYVEI